MIDRKQTPKRMTVLAFGLVAVGLAACGSSSPSKAQGGPVACAPQQIAAVTHSSVLISAMRLSAVVQVSGDRGDSPKCVGLLPGATVTLRIGDSAEFVANAVPQLDGADVVTVSTRPGPTSSGPGTIGGLRTAHLIIRLTAVRTGTVTVDWIDCSGTGC